MTFLVERLADLRQHLRHLREIAPRVIQALRTGTLTDGPTTRTVEWYKSLIQWHETLKGVVQRDVVL